MPCDKGLRDPLFVFLTVAAMLRGCLLVSGQTWPAGSCSGDATWGPGSRMAMEPSLCILLCHAEFPQDYYLSSFSRNF
jgi:hypothetical protein